MRLHLRMNRKQMRRVLRRALFPNKVMREGFEEYQKYFQIPERVLQGRILDVGCNYGDFFSYLRSQGNREAFGVDIRDRVMDGYVRASVASLPFVDGWFDFVVASCFVPMFLPEMRGIKASAVIREMLRVVRPGGVLFFDASDTRHEMLGHLDMPHLPAAWKAERLDAVAAFDRFLVELEGEGYGVLRLCRKSKMINCIKKPLIA